MYGLKRLNSLFTAAAVSPSPVFTSTTYERKVLPPELSRNLPKLTCQSSADGGVCDVYVVGLERLNSTAVSLKRFFGSGPPVRSTHSSRRPLAPAVTARITYEGEVLPPELLRDVLKLTCESSGDGGVCDVYVVGTSHGSKESCEEVKAVVEFLKPQVVFLEMCPGRSWYLEPHELKVPRPTMGDMMEHWKENGILSGTVCSGVFAKFSSENVELPASEFQVAYEEAKKYGGMVVLGDRPVPVKEMNADFRIDLAIQMMSEQIPTIGETFINERDQYMSATLLKVAREHTSVVAVVGKAHLPGIQNNWKQPIEVEQLLSIPSAKNTILKGITIGVAIISAISISIKK